MTASAGTVREQIVYDVILALEGIGGTSGEYYHQVMFVTHWLTPPTNFVEYPALVVADVSESVEQLNFDVHDRRLQMVVTGTMMIPMEYGDTSYATAAELVGDIERALQADVTRGGLAVNTRIQSNSISLVDPAQPYVVVEVELEIHYRTMRDDPDQVK